MRYVTISELSDIIRRNLWKIPHDIDLVVGVPRSGMLPATMIALYLNKQLSDIDSFIEGRTYSVGLSRGESVNHCAIKKVLIVDDSIHSGKAILNAKKKIENSKEKSCNYYYCTPIATSFGSKMVDFFFIIIDEERVFEWNIYHHPILSHACVDIDGVLCADPTVDDDGTIYKEFLGNANPLFIPTYKINTIISCRLEKYRYDTEKWLKANGVLYDNLVMLNLPDKASRLLWNKHGEYKGEYYKQKQDCIIFIESSLTQAKKIAEISNKQVYCVQTNEMIEYCPEKSIVKQVMKHRYSIIRSFLRKFYRKLLLCKNKFRHLFQRCKCPICNAYFDKYLQTGTTSEVWEQYDGVGAGVRNVVCPVCHSTDRERLVYLFFRDYYFAENKDKHIKLLHIAPESNLSKYLMAHTNVEYTAGDKRCDGYTYPDYVRDVDIMNLHDIPDNTYDVLVCNHVLEHVPDDIVAMKELRRVIKPDGIAILQVPYAQKLEKTFEDKTILIPEARFEAYGQNDHVRLYGLDYKNRLESAGFRVKISEISKDYPAKYGLNCNENLFVCYKD